MKNLTLKPKHTVKVHHQQREVNNRFHLFHVIVEMTIQNISMASELLLLLFNIKNFQAWNPNNAPSIWSAEILSYSCGR